jgi:hypothetical protein
MAILCSRVHNFLDGYGRKFEAIGKGFEGRNVIFSLLVGGEDNKRLNLRAASNVGNNEWGVFAYFQLCGCLWEMVVPVCEFGVVGRSLTLVVGCVENESWFSRPSMRRISGQKWDMQMHR